MKYSLVRCMSQSQSLLQPRRANCFGRALHETRPHEASGDVRLTRLRGARRSADLREIHCEWIL